MEKMGTKMDYREATGLEMRRKREEDRKNRIFNAKVRQIGIDTRCLESQIKEKQLIEAMEKRREEAFAADAIKNDKISQILVRREEGDRRRLNCATDTFRRQQQSAVCRREFELNDPDQLKKELPARMSDLDPRCGPASIQKFEGEDLYYEERKKQQTEQVNKWVGQQVRERKRAEDNRKMAEHLYNHKMRELDRRAWELEVAEEECRRTIDQSNSEYNKALLKERELKERHKRQREEEDKRAEIANNVYGDFLTENPDAAISAFGFHRVIPSRWKGMTALQVAEIRKEQEIQRTEIQRRRCGEANDKEEEGRQQAAQMKAVLLMERDLERRKKEMERQLAEENRRMGVVHKKQQRFVNYDLTANEPTSAFFQQFNTGTR